MSSCLPAQLRRNLQRLDAHFLDIVRQTIVELKFNDGELMDLFNECRSAFDLVFELRCSYATVQDVNKYGNLFNRSEPDCNTSLGYGQDQKDMEAHFTAREKDVRKCLHELKYREQRMNQLRTCVWFQFASMKNKERFEIARFVYEKEPFVLLEVIEDSWGASGLTQWLRYDNETKVYQEARLKDYELEEKIKRSNEMLKEFTCVVKETTSSKKSSESSNVKAEEEVTIKSYQAQLPAEPREDAQNIPSKATTMSPDANSATTTHNDDADWDIIDDMVDSEDDTVVVL